MRTLSGVTWTRVSDDASDASRDDGVILVWVALMMVVLVGMGALVIDIGALYVERRELQNGADAAALAVAQDCVEGDCGSGGGSTRAQQYADLNANDGASSVDPSTPCGVGPGLTACSGSAPGGASGATGWVRVDTSTKTSDGDDEVSFLLAPVISSLTGKTVKASAVAAWGPHGRRRRGATRVLRMRIREAPRRSRPCRVPVRQCRYHVPRHESLVRRLPDRTVGPRPARRFRPRHCRRLRAHLVVASMGRCRHRCKPGRRLQRAVDGRTRSW